MTGDSRSALTRVASAGIAAAIVAVALVAQPAVRASVASGPSGPQAAPIDPCDITGVERVVAVGDVHGAYDQLVAILQVSGIIDADLRWAGGQAHFVQTGDIVDRGPAVRKALDLMMRLESEAAQAGGLALALLGNHEVAVMLSDVRSASAEEYGEFRTPDSEAVRERDLRDELGEARRQALAGGQLVSEEAFRSEYLRRTPLGAIERKIAFSSIGAYGKWLRGLNTMVKINGVVFVHGGISPSLAEKGCAVINERVRKDLTKDFDKTIAQPLRSMVASPDGPLWFRGLAQWNGPAAEPQVQTVLRRLKATAIVGGHSVVGSGRIMSRFDGRVFQIDTGMLASVYRGRPSAIEFKGDRAFAIYVDGREELTFAGSAGTLAPAAQAR